MKILYGIIFGTLAQILTFYQLQGQLKIEWFKNHPIIVAFLGVPISFLFMHSVKNMVDAYDGQLWPSRLIGFGIGVVVFTTMSYLLFKEPLTTKTLICLGLGVCIILIQLFWK
jgi:multidrug transporter EmrE-like cation transporter